MDKAKTGKKLFTIDKEMPKSIKAEIADENQRILRLMSFIAAICLLCMVIASIIIKSINGNFILYVSYFAVMLFSFIFAKFQESEKTIRAHVYLFIFATLIFGVLLGTVCSPNELSVSYVVLLFAVPLIFIVAPSINNTIIILTVVIYVGIALFTQTREMLLYNLINIIVYGILSMLVSAFLANIKIQRIYYQKENMLLEINEKKEVEKAATHDKLTGCKNRNALSWVYEGKYDKNLPIAVVVGDLNGLKRVNDLQGHTAGDDYIIKFAKALNAVFDPETIYRIGGDEFLAIQIGPDTWNFEGKIQALRIAVGATASLGYEFRQSADEPFEEILKCADKKMYIEKQKYYAEHPEMKDAHQTIMEYQDIISSAGLGIWHIILKDGKEPRMQVDIKMAELLGIAKEHFTEEEIYHKWYDRIVPSAVPSVNASVQEMIDGSFSENTYQWEHPTKGIIYVRCGGTAINLPDGTKLLRGYHGDVTAIVENDKKHKEALEEIGILQKETLDVINKIHDALGSASWHVTFDNAGKVDSCIWSNRFRQMLGYSSLNDFPDELDSWLSGLHPDDKESTIKAYWDTVNDPTGEKTFNVEYRLMTKNEGYKWFHAVGTITHRLDGTPKMFYGLFMEVKDR